MENPMKIWDDDWGYPLCQETSRNVAGPFILRFWSAQQYECLKLDMVTFSDFLLIVELHNIECGSLNNWSMSKK